MSAVIEHLHGVEILDSRGRPTVLATCRLAGGATGSASVPSGASTGTAEAHELRDREPHRYGGYGCRQAVANVRGAIADAVQGRAFEGQPALDEALLELDGTPDKGRLGANAILAVSLAFARAASSARGIPLYAHLAAEAGRTPASLPRPIVNLFSGGLHAGGQVPIQDVMVVPASARTMDEALAMTYAVYQAAVELAAQAYGMRALTADEGGLAPPFPSVHAMLDDAVAAIRHAGLEPGADVALAIDVAATHFADGSGGYRLGDEQLDPSAMIELIASWVDRYPIVSVEDALGEEAWASWPLLRTAVAGRALVVGDDLLCTNPRRIARAIEASAADTLLLKVNQVGTLTEAAAAATLARRASWRLTVSARSGETEDAWLADLAVAWGGDQIKVGSITQSERLAKYNRLLAIEDEARLPLVPWPAD